MLRRRQLAMLVAAAMTSGAAPSPPRPRIASAATFTDFRYEGRQPLARPLRVTAADYINPILSGSRSDPSIVRVGTDYYLANASFGYWPGQPIWHSTDLVHWQLVASAIDRPDQLDLGAIDPGWQGIWAPDLKYHDGWFYLVNTCYACGGPFAMRTRDVTGPWPTPRFLHLTGIDPSIFFDAGRAYVVFNGLPPGGTPDWEGHRAIWLQEIDPATFTLRSEPTLLVDGGTHPPDHPFWIEGPHLFRKDGYIYLIAAQGGTNEQHAEVVFRSVALRGPYAAGPNPILTQVGLDPHRPDPVVDAGHADVVQTPAGDWWAVFLAARPYPGGDLDFSTGRETFLLPVSWQDGWPTILQAGVPVPLVARRPALADAPVPGWQTAGDATLIDHFDESTLSPRWSLLRSSADRWWHVGGGALSITPRPIELGAGRGQPSFLGLRQAHMDAAVSITVRSTADPGDRAGLAALQDPLHWFFLAITEQTNDRRVLRLLRRNGDAEPVDGVVVARAALPGGDAPIRLRIDAEGSRYRFAYRTDRDGWHSLGGDRDGSFLSTRVAGGFTGIVLGPAAVSDDTSRDRPAVR